MDTNQISYVQSKFTAASDIIQLSTNPNHKNGHYVITNQLNDDTPDKLVTLQIEVEPEVEMRGGGDEKGWVEAGSELVLDFNWLDATRLAYATGLDPLYVVVKGPSRGRLVVKKEQEEENDDDHKKDSHDDEDDDDYDFNYEDDAEKLLKRKKRYIDYTSDEYITEEDGDEDEEYYYYYDSTEEVEENSNMMTFYHSDVIKGLVLYQSYSNRNVSDAEKEDEVDDEKKMEMEDDEVLMEEYKRRKRRDYEKEDDSEDSDNVDSCDLIVKTPRSQKASFRLTIPLKPPSEVLFTKDDNKHILTSQLPVESEKKPEMKEEVSVNEVKDRKVKVIVAVVMALLLLLLIFIAYKCIMMRRKRKKLEEEMNNNVEVAPEEVVKPDAEVRLPVSSSFISFINNHNVRNASFKETLTTQDSQQATPPLPPQDQPPQDQPNNDHQSLNNDQSHYSDIQNIQLQPTPSKLEILPKMRTIKRNRKSPCEPIYSNLQASPVNRPPTNQTSSNSSSTVHSSTNYLFSNKPSTSHPVISQPFTNHSSTSYSPSIHPSNHQPSPNQPPNQSTNPQSSKILSTPRNKKNELKENLKETEKNYELEPEKCSDSETEKGQKKDTKKENGKQDWKIDSTLLKHCRKANPVLHCDQYWV